MDLGSIIVVGLLLVTFYSFSVFIAYEIGKEASSGFSNLRKDEEMTVDDLLEDD